MKLTSNVSIINDICHICYFLENLVNNIAKIFFFEKTKKNDKVHLSYRGIIKYI